MANETSVALAALVVGLVALLIASGQLVQQMFSTVDGYRRCQRSVVGPWSKKTRLVWHWNQFRFETRFTTPEIVLYDWRASQSSHRRRDRASNLQSIIDLDSHQLPYELQETIRPSNPASGGHGNGDMVSWTSLLQQLHKLQSEWYQSYDKHITPPKSPANVVGYSTKIGIIYRERTWDLMPPDSIRPMASLRLGTIIVLAIRLGMTWENLDIGEGLLRAEGNGHTLLSTMMRGYGIVFQYNYNSDISLMYSTQLLRSHSHSSTQGFIPRRTTDMMACGILNSIPTSNMAPVPLRGKSIAETASLLSSALLRLGVPRSTIAKISNFEHLKAMEQQGYESPVGWPINDMVALLSVFQPLKGSTKTQSTYPVQTNVALSVFLLPECRETLLHRLNETLKAPRAAGDDHLREVYTRLHRLQQDYRSDFYCEWDQAIINDPVATLETRTKFIEDLREIHDWTLDHFTKADAQIKYADMVAAHIMLATNAGFSSYHSKQHDIPKYWVETANRYVHEASRNLPDYLNLAINRQPSLIVDRDAVLDAWWTLILRGIVWRMSVFFSHQETVVASRLYYDQTPVYVM